jgi:hypothetical protein
MEGRNNSKSPNERMLGLSFFVVAWDLVDNWNYFKAKKNLPQHLAILY